MELMIELVVAAVVDVLIGLLVSYVTTRLARPGETPGPIGAAA